ncbi:hypothetical protein AB0D63_21015 [Kitasatospora sp. NPDC048343]|uniref:hypothetical protein n=1 Tax=Kitasatospora sp. NPDC048343 TaxID=3154717 RepID=UPI0034047EDD
MTTNTTEPAAPAVHLACPFCKSIDVTLNVREWAVCGTCKRGDKWGQFMICNCWGYDCPAILDCP